MKNVVYKLRDKNQTNLGWGYIKVLERYCHGWERIPAAKSRTGNVQIYKKFTFVILGWDDGDAKDMHHIDEEDFFSDVFMNYDFIEIEES